MAKTGIGKGCIPALPRERDAKRHRRMLEGERNSKTIGVLREARRKIDDLLSDAVPGIKEADAKYAELAKQRSALERGQTVLGEVLGLDSDDAHAKQRIKTLLKTWVSNGALCIETIVDNKSRERRAVRLHT